MKVNFAAATAHAIDRVITENMTVDTLLHSMKDEEIGRLYTALLRIDEVNLLGDGLLKELWLRVKDECESR